MILVDVVFPELNEKIDFQLNENALGWDVVEDMADMAAQRFGREDVHHGELLLYLKETGRRLNLDRSLKENGVSSGDCLLLI